MSPTKINLYKNSLKKLRSSNPLVDLNLYNSSILKRKNHISLNALNDAIKVHNQKDDFTRQSECFTKFWINPVVKNKLEKGNSNIAERMKMHTAGNSLLNIKINNHTSQPAYSVDLKRVAKSQFLKTHVSEILFKDNGFPKRSHQKIQNADDAYISSRNCTLNNNADNVETGKCNSTDAKFKVSKVDYPSAFKLDLSENIDKTSNNVSDTRSNDYIISKYKYIKESKKRINNCLKSLVNIEESTEDIIEDKSKCIPSVIEKETKLDEMKL